MRDLLLIAIVLFCALIAVPRPVFGMLTFICFAFLNPHSMAWTVNETFRSSQVIAAATIGGYFFWSEPKRFPWHRETVILLALWCMFGISTMFAIDPEKAGKFLGHISKILVMVVLSLSLINTERRLYWLLCIIALSLGFYGLKGGIFTIVTGGGEMVWGPKHSFLAANNSIGMALAMNVPLLFYLSKMETRWWLRSIMRIMLIFSYPAVVCTFSRGSWLALGAVTVVIILQHKQRFLLLALAGVLMSAILPTLSQRLPERLVNRYETLVNYEDDDSAQSRFWNWEFCKRVGLANPLHGGGFDFYSPEAYATYFREFSEHWGEKVWSCHSMWFTILAEHGLLGLGLWFVLLASCFFSLRQIRAYGRRHTEMSWLSYADMIQMALIAYIVAGTFLDVAYFDMLYQLVAVVIILKDLICRREAERPASIPAQSVERISFSAARSSALM